MHALNVFFEVQYKVSQGIRYFFCNERKFSEILENLRKKKINPNLKKKFPLCYFLAMQIMGQLRVNFIYMKVHILSSMERIN